MRRVLLAFAIAVSLSSPILAADLKDNVRALGWAPSGAEIKLTEVLPRPPKVSLAEVSAEPTCSEASFQDSEAEALWKRRRPARVLTIWGLTHYGFRAANGSGPTLCQDLGFLVRQWQAALQHPATGKLTLNEVAEIDRAISDVVSGRAPSFGGLTVGVEPRRADIAVPSRPALATVASQARAEIPAQPVASPSEQAVPGSSAKPSDIKTQPLFFNLPAPVVNPGDVPLACKLSQPRTVGSAKMTVPDQFNLISWSNYYFKTPPGCTDWDFISAKWQEAIGSQKTGILTSTDISRIAKEIYGQQGAERGRLAYQKASPAPQETLKENSSAKSLENMTDDEKKIYFERLAKLNREEYDRLPREVRGWMIGYLKTDAQKNISEGEQERNSVTAKLLADLGIGTGVAERRATLGKLKALADIGVPDDKFLAGVSILQNQQLMQYALDLRTANYKTFYGASSHKKATAAQAAFDAEGNSVSSKNSESESAIVDPSSWLISPSAMIKLSTLLPAEKLSKLKTLRGNLAADWQSLRRDARCVRLLEPRNIVRDAEAEAAKAGMRASFAVKKDERIPAEVRQQIFSSVEALQVFVNSPITYNGAGRENLVRLQSEKKISQEVADIGAAVDKMAKETCH